MKLNLSLSALSVAALLAVAPSAMAASATVGTSTDVNVGATVGANGATAGTSATASTSTSGNVSTDHGVSALGMDISSAGDTATSVKSFTSTLTAEQLASLKTRCQAALGAPDSAGADVVAFCKNSMM